jgi:uncharacterized protein (DUF1697 family)
MARRQSGLELVRYAAFLRAINVGGRVVAMADLRALFADLGLAEVETFIASGNVMFCAKASEDAALETRIAAHLRKTLGYEVATFLRTITDVRRITRSVPFDEAERAQAHAVYVGLLHTPTTAADAKALAPLQDETHRFGLSGREVYWLAHEGQAGSKMSGAVLERVLGRPLTLRNANTLDRIAAKFGATAGVP